MLLALAGLGKIVGPATATADDVGPLYLIPEASLAVSPAPVDRQDALQRNQGREPRVLN